jgi:serine/threonine protein kinase
MVIHVTAVRETNIQRSPSGDPSGGAAGHIGLDPEEAAIWPSGWEMQRRIATGRTSRVFRVRSRHGQPRGLCALKLPRVGGPHEAELRKIRRAAFAAEAERLAAVEHARVPRLICAALDHDMPYLVMGYVPGMTLERWRLRRGQEQVGARCSWAEVVGFAEALLQALAACHAAGVAHMDISARNVILRGGALDDPHIVDFGNAISLDGLAPEVRASYRRADLRGTALAMLSLLSDEPELPFWAWGRALHRYGLLRVHIEEAARGLRLPAARLLNFFDAALSLLDDQCLGTASDMQERLAALRPPGPATPEAATTG